MKRRMVLFIFLGIVLQQLVHHIVERWYIGLLIGDFDKYSLGLTWNGWFIVHHVGSVVLLIAGILFGIWLARK